MLILVLTMGGVLGYYAGEPISITLPQDYEYYSIVGNSTPIELNISQDGLNLTIITSKYQQGDTFELLFFDIDSEVIHHYRSSGGSTRYVDRNVTVDVPTYVDKEVVKEIEVEKIVDNTTILQTGLEWWDVLLAFAVAFLFAWFVLRDWGKDEAGPSAEELVDEVNDESSDLR